MSPGTVLFTGFDMMLPVMKYVENLSWWNAGAILLYDFFLVIPLWFCFVVVAGSIIVALIEFQMVALWSLFPMVFALFRGSAFVAAGALSGIIASAVGLGALAFVTGIILPLTFYLTIPLDGKDPAYWNIMAAGAMAVLLGFMAIFAPRYASTFFGGAPAFTGSTLVTAAVGVAAGGMRGVQRWMRS
jgi:type IV secretory pathway TrbL component